jgi:hypothetical protein
MYLPPENMRIVSTRRGIIYEWLSLHQILQDE